MALFGAQVSHRQMVALIQVDLPPIYSTVLSVHSTTTLHPNGNQVASPYWVSHPSSSGTLEYIDAQGHIGAGVGYMYAIEIDGVILQDNYVEEPQISMCSTQRRENGHFLIKC